MNHHVRAQVRNSHRPAHPARYVGAATALLLVALTVTACSHAPVQTRTAPFYPCVEKSRAVGSVANEAQKKPSPLLAWFVSASFDRWIAEIDRIGKRAGFFAPDSSYRAHATEQLRELLTEVGFKNETWLDTKRPFHLFFQQQPVDRAMRATLSKEARFAMGLSALLPTNGNDQFEAALPQDKLQANSEGHSYVLRDKKKVYVDGLNWFTEAVTIHPQRFASARSVAQCMHDRAPAPLFVAGVAVDELHRVLGSKIGALLAESFDELPTKQRKAQTKKVIQKMVTWLGVQLEQLQIVELTGDASAEAISFGVRARARNGTDVQKRMEKLAATPANDLMARLPAASWYASGETYASLYRPEDFSIMLGLYTEALGLDSAHKQRLDKFLTSFLALLGDHSASAMYIDGRFPFAYLSVIESKNPTKLLQQLNEAVALVTDLAGAAYKAQKTRRGAMNEKVAKKVEEGIAKAKEKNLSQWVDELVKRSQTWPVRFSFEEKKIGDATCKVLAGAADMKQLTGNPTAMRVMRFTGPRIEALLCTDSKHVFMGMGPNAGRAVGDFSANKGAQLAKKRSYRSLLVDDKLPTTAMFFDPGPLLDLAGKLMPLPLQWRGGKALSFRCKTAKRAMECDLSIATAVIDLARQLRAAFANFGRRRR